MTQTLLRWPWWVPTDVALSAHGHRPAGKNQAKPWQRIAGRLHALRTRVRAWPTVGMPICP